LTLQHPLFAYPLPQLEKEMPKQKKTQVYENVKKKLEEIEKTFPNAAYISLPFDDWKRTITNLEHCISMPVSQLIIKSSTLFSNPEQLQRDFHQSILDDIASMHDKITLILEFGKLNDTYDRHIRLKQPEIDKLDKLTELLDAFKTLITNLDQCLNPEKYSATVATGNVEDNRISSTP
jgi:hypothetical protein